MTNNNKLLKEKFNEYKNKLIEFNNIKVKIFNNNNNYDNSLLTDKYTSLKQELEDLKVELVVLNYVFNQNYVNTAEIARVLN
jgi:hypothetical protein